MPEPEIVTRKGKPVSVINPIENYEELLDGCRKLAGSKNDWRIRAGDYRVVYEIADKIPSPLLYGNMPKSRA